MRTQAQRAPVRTTDRMGRVVRKGAIVDYKGARYIVLRLRKPNEFSRAYGPQAELLDPARAIPSIVGVADLKVLGYAKRLPIVEEIDVSPSAKEIADHERRRDIRRAGQGASYDPLAEYNRAFEAPLPPHRKSVVRRAPLPQRRRKAPRVPRPVLRAVPDRDIGGALDYRCPYCDAYVGPSGVRLRRGTLVTCSRCKRESEI